ncbi:hypothetical protein [uncultured Mailhella sp.]|uniref:hypothetical protein n=1 Tax=uncultured Mailhella sp. TaxID=1981031 RepID=UPI0025D71109|nr:hypothetical protein [uncultured Mailhella sp.]
MTSISSILRNPKITRTALPLVVYLILTLLPTPEGLTPVAQRAFALVVAGILTFKHTAHRYCHLRTSLCASGGSGRHLLHGGSHEQLHGPGVHLRVRHGLSGHIV